MPEATENPSARQDKAAIRSRSLKAFLQAEAERLGFDLCRITGPDSIQEAGPRLDTYLDQGYHGTMEWMAETRERRASPAALWADVRSVVVFGLNYGPDTDPRGILDKPDKAAISVYARNRDYHDVIKGRLKEIATRFAARSKEDVKVFVDTAPVMEKPLAAAAGLGWQGKHTNLVSRTQGSWLFLGSMFTTAELAIDAPENDHCGSCTACLSACPTDAFPAPYQLDARRCISYLTIEHKGPIEPGLRALIGNRIYGCDDCLAACPWNKFAANASEMKLVAREDLREPSIEFLLGLDDATFRTFFSGSPIKRIGRDRFTRNVLIAAGNSRDRTLIGPCQRLADDSAPVVRGMAAWALARLMTAGEFALFAAERPDDLDEEVREEWRAARIMSCTL